MSAVEASGADLDDGLVREVVARAERGKRTNLTRGGELVAVVVGIDEYRALTGEVGVS